MKKYFFALLISGFVLTDVLAQDIHYSQFYVSNILRNPGLMGVRAEDYKVVGQYKEQWANVGNGFKTGSFSGEFRFPLNRNVNDYVTIGLLGYSDAAGSISFRSIGFYPAVTVNKSLEDAAKSYLSLGFTGGRVTRTIDVSKMTFDNQYQQGSYNSSNGHGEPQLPNPRLSYWDLGAGLSLSSNPSEGLAYYVGLSAYHFTKPSASFYDDRKDVDMHMRWVLSGGLSVDFRENFGAVFHADFVRQGPSQEILVGGLLKWMRPENMDGSNFAVYGGVFFRLQDAIIPTLKVDWNGQTFAFSYDVNISTLRDVTQKRGGMEVSVSRVGFLGGEANRGKQAPGF